MNRSIEEFELTPEQIKACKKIEKAFADAKKLGIRFLAKQFDITAYKEESLKVSVGQHDIYNYGETIPYYSMSQCIDDSGADDMEHFPKGFIN